MIPRRNSSIFFVLCCAALSLFTRAHVDPLEPPLDRDAMIEHAKYSSNYFNNIRSGWNFNSDSEGGDVFPMKIKFGLDVSVLGNLSTYQCLKQAGHSLVIPRGFRSLGIVDVNAVPNILAAHEAGIPNVHTYIFPCPKCNTTGSHQVNELVAALKAGNAPFDMVWLDVEEIKYWHTNLVDNQKFFESMIQGCIDLRVPMGIYVSLHQWTDIFGVNYTIGGGYPLWYPRYDNKLTFNNYAPFADWPKVKIKQFSDHGLLCGIDFDVNVY